MFQESSAQVVCRQLGFSTANDTIFIFGDSGIISPIWLDNVQCVGNETKLIDCPSNEVGVNNCSRRNDIGLRCGKKIITYFLQGVAVLIDMDKSFIYERTPTSSPDIT